MQPSQTVNKRLRWRGIVLALILLERPYSALALSSSAISTAMGGGALKGSTLPAQSNRDFAITMVSNGSHALVALTIQKDAADIGWMSIGLGSSMLNTEMYITWPNGQDDWVVSHREATGYVVPDVLSQGSASIQLVPSLFSASPATVAFSRPLSAAGLTEIKEEASVKLIYAYSTKKPSTPSDPNSNLQEHDGGYSATTLDLSASFARASSSNTGSGASSGSDSSSQPSASGSKENGTNSPPSKTGTASDAGSNGTSSSDDSDSDDIDVGSDTSVVTTAPSLDPDNLIKAHIALGLIGWGLISPVAVLIARFRIGNAVLNDAGERISAPFWIKSHEFLQKYVTTGCSAACVALGSSYIATKKSMHFNSNHQICGALLLILLLFQVTLGWAIHHLFVKRDFTPFRNVLHVILGVFLLALGFYQLYSGYDLAKSKGIELPSWLNIACWFSLILYFAFFGSLLKSAMFGTIVFAVFGVVGFFFLVSLVILISKRYKRLNQAMVPAPLFTAMCGLGSRKTIKPWDMHTPMMQQTMPSQTMQMPYRMGSDYTVSSMESMRKKPWG